MQAAPGSCTGGGPLRAPYVCRQCREPVTIQGDPQWGRAVHTVTGQETGPGGQVAAPVDPALVRAMTAREAGERP